MQSMKKRTCFSLPAVLIIGLICFGVYFVRMHQCDCNVTQTSATQVKEFGELRNGQGLRGITPLPGVGKMEDPVDMRKVTAAGKTLSLETGIEKMDDPHLLAELSRHWIQAPSRLPLTLRNKGVVDHSQAGQSKLIDQHLNQRRNGFFVECGAGSGEHISNSLFFEIARNWTGLLVEANPSLYKGLLNTHRHAYSINACLSANNKTGQFPFFFNKYLGGLVSHNMKRTKKGKHVLKSTDVQCFNLYSIMLAIGQTHIDYFSLDVEGAELDILRSIPFDKLTIDIFTIEYRAPRRGTSSQKLAELRKFFKLKGNYKDLGIIYGTDRRGLDAVFMRQTENE